MPIYEYKCDACGKIEELLENLSSSNCHACSTCGAPMSMQRQHSIPSVRNGSSCGTASTESEACKGSGCNCPFAR